MKSLFEEMGGTYRQVGDYLIPNLVLPDEVNYQMDKYGRMRRSYLKEHRKILYTNYVIRSAARITLAPNSRGMTLTNSSQPAQTISSMSGAPSSFLRMAEPWAPQPHTITFFIF